LVEKIGEREGYREQASAKESGRARERKRARGKAREVESTSACVKAQLTKGCPNTGLHNQKGRQDKVEIGREDRHYHGACGDEADERRALFYCRHFHDP